MTVDELGEHIKQLKARGRITGDTDVYVRDPNVSDEAIEAGSRGYVDLDEILVLDGEHLLLYPMPE